ncbi:capsular polysaccharide export protein, LipB/KpsS family [Aliarcobacter cryaerophilus]|uniref:Capsule polysaccharide biosynthesis protein n=2 Tax=unclassified Arcobacter TaxID=2593671 RepID=A0AA96IBC6_9BACT|nr:hypothetical protein RJG52_00805 [Arcobacter sp. AZ-2023]WPD09109.1 hypothetical protein QUR77_07780 [Arcobacter sp. DSM 115954]WNL13940.1 hypothetical protein RJG51_07830 [Arcobacter sp. AZ-2023]WNL20179.1 hypothetical protein RJG53_05450 [Arcobacter sp. AZ-2023]WNL22321.1 hypothetical protein RJG56_05300 [Arcobacter sp. AZ-2023]
MIDILRQFFKSYFLDILLKIKKYRTFPTKEEKSFCDFLKNRLNLSKESNQKILVEGGLIGYGPNYFFRLLTLIDLYINKYNLSPEIMFHGFPTQYNKAKALLREFNLKNYIYSKGSLWLFIQSYFYSIFIFYKINLKNIELKYLKYKNIQIGDFIIDSYLKQYNSPHKNKEIFKFIFESIYLVNFYKKLLNPKIYKIVLVTHTQYVEYGIFARVAFYNNIVVVETTDMQILVSNPFEANKIKYPSFHSSLREMINKQILDINNKEEFLFKSKKHLEDRLNGKFNQYDLKEAYRNKKIYSDLELRKTLNIQNKNPFIFIMAHVFSDAPLSIGENMLFDDYYEWIIFTIKEASLNKNINFIVKPHPSSYIYKEDGIVKNLISEFNLSNIYLAPEDFNTFSLKDLAKTIITARGTVGIEYTSLGIPVILAGDTFYSDFGFTIEPKTKEEYKKVLLNLNNTITLTSFQIDMALMIYGIFSNLNNLENDIITTEVLNYVWGMNGYEVNTNLAYEIITNNLKNFDFRKLSYLSIANEIELFI